MKETSLGGDWEVNAAATLHRAFTEKHTQRSEVCETNNGGEEGMGVGKSFLSPNPELLLLRLF